MSNNASPIFNQLGFTPKSQKTVVITECGPWDLNVYDENGEKVLTASPSKAGEWEYSGETVQSYDLTTLNKPGQYYLIRNNKRFDLPLTISIDVYHGLAKSSLKWFYYQRASMELEKKYAGKWARAAGHSDIHVKVYDDPNRFISAPKGWYDAGDYGKYIVNSAISVFTLLQLEEHFPEYVKNLKWNIPEDEQIQNLPDLLSEVKYNLDWMLAMQESDGGVFHKLSTLKFCPHYAPAQDTADRYVIGKTTSATLDFAGNMAQASILVSKYDSE